MKIIRFISTFKHYDDEELGIKPYTIRKLTERLQKKIDKNPTHIEIQRAYTKRDFMRRITHTLFWDEWVIFSWNPNELISKPIVRKEVLNELLK